MVKGNCKLFNIKAALAHHPVIQKDVDEPLAKGAIEPSNGGACFALMCVWYQNVWVVCNP